MSRTFVETQRSNLRPEQSTKLVLRSTGSAKPGTRQAYDRLVKFDEVRLTDSVAHDRVAHLLYKNTNKYKIQFNEDIIYKVVFF